MPITAPTSPTTAAQLLAYRRELTDGGVDDASANLMVRDAALHLLSNAPLLLRPADDTPGSAAPSDSVAPAPAPQVPSLGRIVLVAMDPATNNGATLAAAVITRAWNEHTVNVCILPDHKDGTAWRTSVTYAPDLADLDADDPGRLARWTWPPRV